MVRLHLNLTWAPRIGQVTQADLIDSSYTISRMTTQHNTFIFNKENTGDPLGSSQQRSSWVPLELEDLRPNLVTIRVWGHVLKGSFGTRLGPVLIQWAPGPIYIMFNT